MKHKIYLTFSLVFILVFSLMGSGCAALQQDQSEPWILMVPIQSLEGEDSHCTVDLGAYYRDLAAIESLESIDGPLAPLTITIESSVVDQRPTVLAVSAHGKTSARKFVQVGLTHLNHERSEAVLVFDYQYLPKHTFVYSNSGAKSVSLVGEFNGWNASANPLIFDEGIWQTTLQLTSGKYRYKFVVDGEWIPDPANPDSEPDGYTGFNSIIEIQENTQHRDWSLWAVPQGKSLTDNTLTWICEGMDTKPKQVMLMGGNQILVQWPSPDALIVVDGNQIRITLTDTMSGMMPDGNLRLLVQDQAGQWADTFLYRSPAEHMSPQWRGRTIYFALTDRFADGNPDNNQPIQHDKLKPAVNWQGGDWQGLREKIEEGYFDAMGVGAIWISAVNRQTEAAEKESVPPGDLFSAYHGYWPTSPDETNPHFGTMEELKTLVRAAHQQGIAVLLDLVANHTHVDHPWYQEHPEWYGDLVLPDGSQNIRKFDAHPYTTWFDTFIPSIDYANHREAAEAMVANAVWWIEQTGVDGFRQDAVKHIQPYFWQLMTRALRDGIELPDGRRLYQVGETISSRQTINQFVSGEMLQGQFDFPLYWPLRDALATESVTMKTLAEAIDTSTDEYAPEAIMSPLIGNHDVSRFMAWADCDLNGVDEKETGRAGTISVDDPASYKKIMLAQALLLSLPGNPMHYYGDEIGMTGASDPDNRRMMQFGDQINPLQQEVLDNVRSWGQLRRQLPALQLGTIRILLANEDNLIFARVLTGHDKFPDSAIIFGLNRSRTPGHISITLPPSLEKAKDIETLSPDLKDANRTNTLSEGALELYLPAQSAGLIELIF